MARFHGLIGFVQTKETSPGVFVEDEIARYYFGDVKRYGYRWDHGYGINDHPVVTNYIEIIADDFSIKNVGYMRWIEWNGVKWSINSAEINRPRITITFAGVYNATSNSDDTTQDTDGTDEEF